MEKYLGSDMVKGIGPVFAKQLIKSFCVNIFDIIEQHPDKLFEVKSIGKNDSKRLVLLWQNKKRSGKS
ncbi:MAG: helix-hairpin-helix domain-containing protein [Arsenophonus sp. NEOnobi-MAG3]